MKNEKRFIIFIVCLVIIALIATTWFTSCTKQVFPQQPDCQAVTYYIDEYDNNWKYKSTYVSVHWCKVCGSELETFKKQSISQIICNSTDILRMVINKDTCKNNSNL